MPKWAAIEFRINAEDVDKDFRPTPGRITGLHIPGGLGVRVDQAVYTGYTIPPYYDSMIAKLIVKARTRREALIRMERALDEFIVEGVPTTIPFHRKVVKHPDFVAGNYDLTFVESALEKDRAEPESTPGRMVLKRGQEPVDAKKPEEPVGGPEAIAQMEHIGNAGSEEA